MLIENKDGLTIIYAEGTNKITIKVTAENGNTKEYIINRIKNELKK